MGHETWDLFDRRTHQLVGQYTRGFCIPEHWYHIAVEVICTDGKGHLLITRRALQKKKDPGKYEFTSGSVISGETPEQAAKRELMEETGLTAQKLEHIETIYIPGIRRDLFLAVLPDLTHSPIRLQPGETMGYRFVSTEVWQDMIRKGLFSPQRVIHYTEDFYRKVEAAAGPCPPEPLHKPAKLVPAQLRVAMPKETPTLIEMEEINP